MPPRSSGALQAALFGPVRACSKMPQTSPNADGSDNDNDNDSDSHDENADSDDDDDDGEAEVELSSSSSSSSSSCSSSSSYAVSVVHESSVKMYNDKMCPTCNSDRNTRIDFCKKPVDAACMLLVCSGCNSAFCLFADVQCCSVCTWLCTYQRGVEKRGKFLYEGLGVGDVKMCYDYMPGHHEVLYQFKRVQDDLSSPLQRRTQRHAFDCARDLLRTAREHSNVLRYLIFCVTLGSHSGVPVRALFPRDVHTIHADSHDDDQERAKRTRTL